MVQPASFTMPEDDGSTERCARCGEEWGEHDQVFDHETNASYVCPAAWSDVLDEHVFKPEVDDRSPSEARAETMGYD